MTRTNTPVTAREGRWPMLARDPKGPAALIGAAVADFLLRRAAARLPMRLVYPDGTVVSPDPRDTELPALVLRDPWRFARRVGRDGLVGFGESYMAGEWDSPDLVEVLTVLATSLASLVPPALQLFRPLFAVRQPSSHRNTPERARANVARHYDVSNDFFALFLDPSMTYSSALFDRFPASEEDMAAAQRRKIDRLLDAACVGKGSSVLEIGTGWGELCLRAAARGARVRSVTLSAEQQRLARRRVALAGMADQVDVELCDYRDVEGVFDCVVSVEMIEAVGYEYWPVYFRTLDRLVRPGGRVAIQAITMPHDRMLASRRTHTWIQKYIFPGGFLPSVRALNEVASAQSALRSVDMLSLRPHYAETLRIWRERLLSRRHEAAAQGFDEVFLRMWEFYLAYSEAGFRSDYLDVHQWAFVKEGSTL